MIRHNQKYPFANFNPDSLKAAINLVYKMYPGLIKSDTTLYGRNNGEDFYFLLDDDGQINVFQCNVIIYSAPYDKEIDLALTTATVWGETMQLATKMKSSKKKV